MTLPAPGWYVDPSDPRGLRWWSGAMWTAYTAPVPAPSRPPLDVAVETLKRDDPQPWGWRPVVLPLAAYVVLIAGTQILSHTVAPSGTAGTVFAIVANVVIQALLVLAVYLGGREIAARNGGWGRAFGWRPLRWADWPPALAGFGISLALRLAIGIVVVIVAGPDAARESRNITVTDHVTVAGTILLLLVAVVFAPLVEELVFRGLLLRTFLRRMRFWPAAILSTAIFAVGHTYEVGTVEGATVLALSVGVVGIVNCELNRRTDRLAPGILAHAMANGLATITILATYAT